jgi:hypothetical protein
MDAFKSPASTIVDYDKLADTLMRAIGKLPFAEFVELNNVEDPSTFEYWKGVIQTVKKQDGLFLQCHDHESIAIWNKPNPSRISQEDVDCTRGPVIPLDSLVGFAKVRRLFTQTALKYNLHNTPHWFLKFLARHPNSQTAGSVSCLVKPVMAKARDEGVPVVLICINQQAKPIYEHWGFEVLEEMTTDNGLQLWYMIKKPEKMN